MFPVRLFILLIALLPGLAFAEAIPRGGPNDNRVRLATYQEGQVYRLSVSLTHVTTVEFGEGESIRSIIAGDTEGFEIDGVPGGQAFAIKPVARGVHTNVTVYTNRRSYYFNLEETRSPTFYVVQFRYPEDNTRPTRAIAAQAPNYNYGASARTEFTPTRVWDDGTFTYFEFPRNAPVPAIFRYANGRERTVNTQATEDSVIRVSGVNGQWVLRIGDEVVCIKATPPTGVRSCATPETLTSKSALPPLSKAKAPGRPLPHGAHRCSHWSLSSRSGRVVHCSI